MKVIAHKVREMARAELPWLSAIRRHLHAHPELSFQEVESTRFIGETLNLLGVAHAPLPLPTGLIATVGVGGGRRIGLRADIDALNIAEENDLPYRSATPGVMHACGHDGHTAILLGAVKLLSVLLPQLGLPGTVHALFQPAEESPAPSGAQQLVEAGLLRDYPVEEIYALHLWPWMPVGTAGTREGPIMAAADGLHLTVQGRSGHAGRPHDAIDAIAVMAHLLSSLHYVTDRRVDPLRPVAVTFGRIQGGVRHSIVAQSCEAWGTLRTLDDATRERMHSLLPRTVARAAEALGANATLAIHPSQPRTVNHPEAARRAYRAACHALGETGAVWLPEGALTAEDFSRFAQEVPGAFLWLGAGWPEGSGRESYPLHHPRFDLPEEALAHGAALLALAALEGLGAADSLILGMEGFQWSSIC